MKPKPFSPLNHFTVPVLTNNPSLLALLEPDRCSMGADPKAERELLEDARSRLVPNPHSRVYTVGAAPDFTAPASATPAGSSCRRDLRTSPTTCPRHRLAGTAPAEP